MAEDVVEAYRTFDEDGMKPYDMLSEKRCTRPCEKTSGPYGGFLKNEITGMSTL
jgi:hypothetical protein